MNQSTSFPNIERLRVNSRQTPTGSLMYAFNLPSSNPCSSLPRSQWHGKPVCKPRVVLTTQNFRVATVRRKLLTVSKVTDRTDPGVVNADSARSVPETDEKSGIHAPIASKPTSIWLFVVENAVQVTILALAIAGSIHTRRRVWVHLVALLSVPQLALMVNRIWRRIRSSVQPVLAFTESPVLVEDKAFVSIDEDRAPTSDDEDEVPVKEPIPSTVAEDEQREELALAQSKIISTSIRNAVAEEVDTLRYAIEQIEQTTEERQQARNLVIAEAIASLDGSLRSLRRSIDTRNQVEKSAPFALVSELEIVKSRLKQAEQEKMELEVRLRAAEDNFEEAKRQGERARREADEASSKELSLRTELAVASGRLLRLEEVTERLDKAERRNDELQEQLINGTREQEGLRQSAEDAARRVLRVENVAKILREKIQEISGKPLSRYGQDGGELFGDAKEKSDDQFWPQRLRSKGDLKPDSVIYQELLRDDKGSRSPQWPRDPLGIERSRQDRAQLKKLPDDGGFGVGSTDENASDSSSNNKMLSSEGSSDTIFSFSRGEFHDSRMQEEREMPSEEDAKSLKESSKSPVESSKVVSSPEDSISVVKQNQDGSEDDATQSGYQLEKPSQVSARKAVELTDQAVAGSKSSVQMATSESSPQERNVVDVIKSPSSVEAPEGKDSLINNRSPPASFESASKEEQEKQDKGLSETTDEKQDVAPSDTTDEEQDVGPFDTTDEEQDVRPPDTTGEEQDMRPSDTIDEEHDVGPPDTINQVAEEKLETFQESIDLVERDAVSGNGGENQHTVERDAAYFRDTEPQKDDQTLPVEPIISTESSSDSRHPDKQDVEHTAPKTTAVADEAKVVTVEQKTTSYLESLSEKGQSKPVETVEDQLRTSRGLVKKARTRGLAVKQADLLFQKATRKLESALEQGDDRDEVEAELGGCLLAWAKTNIADPLSQERLSRALELLTSSVESQPDNEAVLFNTGLCLCLLASTSSMGKALGDYQKACDMYERLLELNDNSRMACFNCGLAYVSLGRLSLGNESDEKSRGFFERAATLFQRSLELKPGDSKAISYLDDCRRQLRELDAV